MRVGEELEGLRILWGNADIEAKTPKIPKIPTIWNQVGTPPKVESVPAI